MTDSRTRDEKIAAVIRAAKVEVDGAYKEGENNDTKFGRWFGLNFNPWCAMFVSWCFSEAGLSHLVAATSRKGFASCTAGMRWFAKNGNLVPVGKAERGDIVFFNFDDDLTDAEHVGIVLRNDGKYLYTAEGNTTNPKVKGGNQSNGDGAYYKKRDYGKVLAVARPQWDLPAAAPKPVAATPVAKKAAVKKPVAKKAAKKK